MNCQTTKPRLFRQPLLSVWCLRDFALLAMSWLLLAPGAGALGAEPTIYIKDRNASLLFQFLRATEWPAEAFQGASSPLVLGILGKDSFGTRLDGITNKVVGHRPIVLKRFNSAEEARHCHLVFVSSGTEQAVRDVLDDLALANILTIGESKEFIRYGGIVSLSEDEKYGFELSARALKRTGLKIDTGLKEFGKLIK
jgi:hypothetical protein